MIAGSLAGCCHRRHCIHGGRQICSMTAVVVSICFAYILPSASSTLLIPLLKPSCHLDGVCPEFFYCDFNHKLCYPCSGTSTMSDTRPLTTCHWPGLKESDTQYPMDRYKPELTPSCNASALDASSLMSGSCSNTCSRMPYGGVYCFAGSLCNVTCSLTADSWNGKCVCQRVQTGNHSRFSCSWSSPLPTCASINQDATTVAGGLPGWQFTVSDVGPAETTADAGQSEAAAMPSQAATRDATIGGCVAVGVAVVAASVVVGLLLHRRSRRLAAKGSNSGGAGHLDGVSTMPPGDSHSTGPPSQVQTPPTIIVNNVTNYTNVAVMSAVEHLTVSNGAVMEQTVQRQHRSTSGEAGKQHCCCTTVPVVAADSLAARDERDDDGLGSDADNGCRQPLLTAVCSPPSCSRCLQAAVGTRLEQRPHHLGDAGCPDVILPQAENSDRCCYPDSATVHGCVVRDSPKIEPSPIDFVDDCTDANDTSRDLEAPLMAGHCEFAADADDDEGSIGATVSEPEVPDSAYCSTDSSDHVAIGVVPHVHNSSIGLVTIKAACVKNCELQLAAADSRLPSSAPSAADDRVGSRGASNAAVHLELGYVDMLRVAASAGES